MVQTPFKFQTKMSSIQSKRKYHPKQYPSYVLGSDWYSDVWVFRLNKWPLQIWTSIPEFRCFLCSRINSIKQFWCKLDQKGVIKLVESILNLAYTKFVLNDWLFWVSGICIPRVNLLTQQKMVLPKEWTDRTAKNLKVARVQLDGEERRRPWDSRSRTSSETAWWTPSTGTACGRSFRHTN